MTTLTILLIGALSQTMVQAVAPKKPTLAATSGQTYVSGIYFKLKCTKDKSDLSSGPYTYKLFNGNIKVDEIATGTEFNILAKNTPKPDYKYTCTVTDKDKVESVRSNVLPITVVVPIDCQSISCQNNRPCSKIEAKKQLGSSTPVAQFYCDCRGSPFSGTFCEKSACDKLACAHNSTCKMDDPSQETSKASCNCKVGSKDKHKWQGRSCNVENKGNCRYVTCANGGICSVTTSSNGFKCACEPDWEGPFCKIGKTALVVKPDRKVFEKGEKVTFRCTTPANKAVKKRIFKLLGPGGDEGSRLRSTSGSTTAIFHDFGSKYLNTIGTFTYKCTMEQTEPTTTKPILTSRSLVITVVDKKGQCNNIICSNGGTCTEVNGEPTCNCLPGFDGKYCGLRKSQTSCNQVRCQNQAPCTQTATGFKCNCLSGYFGTFCEKNAPQQNEACSESSDCDGLPCSPNLVGYCAVPDFRCRCKAKPPVIACESNSDCSTKCPTKHGLCMANKKCKCFVDIGQLLVFMKNNNYPSGLNQA